MAPGTTATCTKPLEATTKKGFQLSVTNRKPNSPQTTNFASGVARCEGGKDGFFLSRVCVSHGSTSSHGQGRLTAHVIVIIR